MQITLPNTNIPSKIEGDSVYSRVKSLIMSHKLPPEKRIRPEPLADQLRVSTTPVREALIQLSAEKLIEDVPKAGFFIKDTSESEMRGLYMLNQSVLDLALEIVSTDNQLAGILKPPKFFENPDHALTHSPDSIVATMQELFIHIARQTGVDNITHIIGNINDRTHYVRLEECELNRNIVDCLAKMCRTYYQQDMKKLQAELHHFHKNQIELLPKVIRLIKQTQAGQTMLDPKAE